ncbi:sarcosine oxidase subunit beta [Gluconacetobacter liquefaciens]|uniref:FAD-binding oxidoreductase n=1 Tax=Gluconacetobacter liquefaciens TaxID=89584 RepID=A0A370GAI0_GLULI|nr:FAD-binding oxidoreductase [Gluconacetobacter liquefaciens]MBB2185396.1 FAD-binding oxidoreductase [Gluconacetobacter liquefaciens]RDI40842.1 sarcosine oxidase subunit beta [Gluconacetobacter liquefaciens]GBR01204.1 FAD dependent oxidoreductase [Gluconacetobacter liquefaciens NRIC 0522]GEB39329.1 sarcosine oxidase subunit beta [Gluconacetobacter liquefaciens]
MSQDTELIVIGGGLQGLSTAFWAARAGLRVTVVEKSMPGRHASGFSAGGVRTLGRALPEIPLALAALDLWYDLPTLLDDDGGFVPSAQVRIAENDADMRSLRERVAVTDALGWTHEVLLDEAEVKTLLPAVAPHVVGGLVCRRDGFADPMRTTRAFLRAATRAGAVVRVGAGVAGLERVQGGWRVTLEDGSHLGAPRIVNAAGAWGRRIARMVGDDFPLGFNALMMMFTAPLPPFITQVALATGRPLSFKQVASGHVMIGGGPKGVADLDTGLTTLDVTRLAASARTALELFPVLKDVAILHAWAGIEAIMPDEIPVIGRSSRAEGIVHLCGFSGHGFALSPLTGRIAADLVLGRESPYPIEAFSPDRFVPGVDTDRPSGTMLQPAG